MVLARRLREHEPDAGGACIRRRAATLIAAVLVSVFATGQAGAAKHPRTPTTPDDSAISQYVEQIPTAHGSDATSSYSPRPVSPAKRKKVAQAALASSGGLGTAALVAIVGGGAAASIVTAFVLRRRLR